MKYLNVSLRSLFFYILIGVLYRLMGKREVSELSLMDLVVSIFIAQIASIAIENYKENIFISILPIGVLVLLEILSSYIELKKNNTRKIIDGTQAVIINRGKVDFEEMSKQRYNLEDMLLQLRNQGIKSLDEVDYAILETNGELSIFKKSDDKNRLYPLPIIVDGIVQTHTLKEINKTTLWLEKELQKDNLKIEDIFYAFYKNKNIFIIQKENNI